MITRSRELIIKSDMDVSVHRHELGSCTSATLTFRSVRGSHISSIHLTIEEASQLAGALAYIAETK